MLPARPEAEQANPKQSVSGVEFGFERLPFEHGELMWERQILKHEPGLGLESGEQGAEKREENIKHDEADFGRSY